MTAHGAVDHEATADEMVTLKAARQRLDEAHAKVPEDGSPVPHTALTELLEASQAFRAAVHTVLYGPSSESEDEQGPKRGRLYDLSNDLARDHWPSPPPTPGG